MAAARRVTEESSTLNDLYRCAHLTSLAQLAGARTIAAYCALPGEPDPAGAVARWRAQGLRVLLPVLLADHDLGLAEAGEALLPGPFGLREPVLSEPVERARERWASVDLVVVPALAVDRIGTRLGRGGGSYDRALARTRAPAVALLREGELLDSLPAEPHDRPVSAAVLPRGIYWLAG